MIKYLLTALIMLTGCASGGIGVLYNKKGVVKYVFDKSPAQQSGILLEDIINNTKQLRGPIGTICLVKYTRNGIAHEQSIMRVDVDTFHIPDYGSFAQKGSKK